MTAQVAAVLDGGAATPLGVVPESKLLVLASLQRSGLQRREM